MAIEMAHLRHESYPNRLGRVRIDHDFLPWLLVGIEYLSLGAHKIDGIDYPGVVQDGQGYVSGLFTSGKPVAFQLASQLDFPPQQIDLSGWSFGVFLRLR